MNADKFEQKPFIQNLYNANSLDEQFSELENLIKSAGFDGVFYTFIPKLSLLNKKIVPVFQYSKSYSGYHKYYVKNKFHLKDPGIRLISEGRLDPIDWCDAVDKKMVKKNELHSILTSRARFNIRTSITIPTLSNDQGIASVNIVSKKKKINLIQSNRNKELIQKLQLCSRQYHDYTMIHHDNRYKFLLPVLNTLSKKQKLVIKYLISGKPMKNIADEMDITTRYAEKLMCELRRNFGKISTNELIYSLGLLNISEYI